MKEISILITGIGRRVELTQAFRSAARAMGQPLRLVGADLTSAAPALAFCDAARLVPPMKAEGYLEALLRICREDRIDLLIPVTDTDLLLLSENRERFEAEGTRVLISDPEFIRICRNKNLTPAFFVECGLRAPLPVSDWREYRSGYPAFIKPMDGSSSVNAYPAGTEDELRFYAGQIGNYTVQPCIRGREYTLDIFCDWDGNPIHVTPRERLRVRAGEVLQTRIDLDPVMIQESRQLCRKAKPAGPLTVQLIRSKEDGLDYFIEINPRFGGGAPLSIKAGADSAEAVLRLVRGEPPRSGQAANGAVYCRFDQSVCLSEGERAPVRGVIFDLDDTLYGEKEYIRSGFRCVAEFLGNAEYADRLWRLREEGRPAIDALLEETGRTDLREQALAVYRSHRPDIHLYEGVREMLEALRSSGKKIGILTDGRPEGQRRKLEALGLEPFADDILITDELGGPQFRKPCDIAFRILQNRWRIPCQELLYVGDHSAKDFPAPRQLGMKCLWFRNSDGIYAAEDPGQLNLPSADSISAVSAYLNG